MMDAEGTSLLISSKEPAHPTRLIPNREFEIIPLRSDPSRGVRIGADLPDLEKIQLEACLNENVDLFAWSATVMPDLDLKIACHHLTIDPSLKGVAQRGASRLQRK